MSSPTTVGNALVKQGSDSYSLRNDPNEQAGEAKALAGLILNSEPVVAKVTTLGGAAFRSEAIAAALAENPLHTAIFKGHKMEVTKGGTSRKKAPISTAITALPYTLLSLEYARKFFADLSQKAAGQIEVLKEPFLQLAQKEIWKDQSAKNNPLREALGSNLRHIYDLCPALRESPEGAALLEAFFNAIGLTTEKKKKA